MQEAIFPDALTATLMQIMGLLKLAVARHCPTVAEFRPARILVWRWLRRTERRLLALIEAFRAGTLPEPGPPSSHRRRPSDPAAERPPVTRYVIAARVGWFVDAQPQIGFASWLLRDLLGETQVEAFVAQSPRAGGHFRALCRALGLPPPSYLKRRWTPPVPEHPEPPAEPKAKPAPQGPPWYTEHPPPEGFLLPHEEWRARHGIWIPTRIGTPRPIEET